MPTPVCEAARSAPADAACLGSGSAARTLGHPCIGRLSVAGGTARARWLRQLAAVCWAEVLPATTTEADRALGPMLPSSARGHWPFCVVRDSCRGRSSAGSARVASQLARDAGLVALAATRTPSDSQLVVDTAWMQGGLGFAARVCLCQITTAMSNGHRRSQAI